MTQYEMDYEPPKPYREKVLGVCVNILWLIITILVVVLLMVSYVVETLIIPISFVIGLIINHNSIYYVSNKLHYSNTVTHIFDKGMYGE